MVWNEDAAGNRGLRLNVAIDTFHDLGVLRDVMGRAIGFAASSRTTKARLWFGSGHGAAIVKPEPLDGTRGLTAN